MVASLVVSERIFGQHSLENCVELPPHPMLPIVLCSPSLGRSFPFDLTKPVAIYTRPAGDRWTALPLFSRTHPLHFSLNRLIRQKSRSLIFGPPNLPTCTKYTCGCLCEGKTYSLWTSLHWRKSPVVDCPVHCCRCHRSFQLRLSRSVHLFQHDR